LKPRVLTASVSPTTQFEMGLANSTMAADEAQLRTALADVGQSHLISTWTGQTANTDKLRFMKQLQQLDSSYPGGVKGYVTNARQLLADSKAGVNPLEGWSPSVPDGATLEFGSNSFLEYEADGIKEAAGCAFVLVAGGLGERLGFSGIKVALPWQTSSGQTYIELYIRSILAMQQEASVVEGRPVQLPLAIMVSDDTAARTETLLKANDYFGMSAEQVCVAHALRSDRSRGSH
jgi:UDP-sugar pyrophosphorylase